MALILKPTDLGSGKLKDDYEVLAKDRRSIGRIILHPQAPPGQPWFWTITARFPQHPHDRGYAESREQAMADFKMARQRKSVVVRREANPWWCVENLSDSAARCPDLPKDGAGQSSLSECYENLNDAF
jgi:hypothetical protein